MEQRLTIVTLGVLDLKASCAFYEGKLGWKKLSASNDNIVFFQLNGILLSLYPSAKLAEDAGVEALGNGFKGFTLAYNTTTKEEVDDLMRKFKDQGVKIVKKPEWVFWGGYSGYIADPDHHLWEIAFNPHLLLDKNGDVVGE